MADDSWTAERVGLLQRLWAEGATAAAIGSRLGGLSRSAVLGKIFRLRLRATDGAVSPRFAQVQHGGTEIAVPARRRKRSKYKTRSQPPPEAESQRKTLLALTNKSCRWPHGQPGTDRYRSST